MNDENTDREDGAQGGRDTFEDDGRTCDRCGGAAVPDRSGAAVVLECGDCGNVLGLAEAAFDADSPTDRPSRTDEVTAADGELAQLVTLLRSEGTDAAGSGPSISTDRLLLATNRRPSRSGRRTTAWRSGRSIGATTERAPRRGRPARSGGYLEARELLVSYDPNPEASTLPRDRAAPG